MHDAILRQILTPLDRRVGEGFAGDDRRILASAQYLASGAKLLRRDRPPPFSNSPRAIGAPIHQSPEQAFGATNAGRRRITTDTKTTAQIGGAPRRGRESH